MAKKLDILLAARPDHSYLIYQELRKSALSFLYVTFKLIPKWISSVRMFKNIRTVDKNYSICWSMTLLNWLKYNKELSFTFDESKLFSLHLKRVLSKYQPRIIHYWPDYFADLVDEYSKKDSQVITIADLYFPCRQYVISCVSDLFSSYGLDSQIDLLRGEIERYNHLMQMEKHFIVPSKFVADSYLQYYPNKTFYIIPYGVAKWKHYRKKTVSESPKRFVYVGTISVAKGCDILCEWFSKNCDYEIHIFGRVPKAEERIFTRFKSCANIVFEGHVEKTRIQDRISSFDIGIHLSRFDAYSLAVGEIIGCGIPVIVSEFTGQKDEILEHNLGVVTALSEDSILSCVKKVINEYEYYVDRIDRFLTQNSESYPEKVLRLYNRLVYEGVHTRCESKE